MKLRINDIEDDLERADARYERFIKIRAIQQAYKANVIRTRFVIGTILLLWAAYSILSRMQ